MAGAIWEDYTDGEILDEVMKRLGVGEELDNMTKLFTRIDELVGGEVKKEDAKKEDAKPLIIIGKHSTQNKVATIKER
jgi:hypothetical protein